TALGVSGVTATNLNSINSAGDALGSANVASKAQVQAVVDAYIRVLAAAKNISVPSWVPSSADPTVTDFLTIGVNLGKAGSDGQNGRATDAQQAAALNLLDSLIASAADAVKVDSILKINNLAIIVDKLMALSKGDAPTAALTADDLTKLGATGATADNLSIIVDGIKASADDGTGINSLRLLQGVVSQFVIAAYADQDSNPAPTLQDYTNIGVNNHVNSSNLSAVNDAIRSKPKGDVDTLAEVQSIVDAYRKILADASSAADGSGRTAATDPTVSDWQTIGATIGIAGTAGNAQQAAALNLLDDALVRKASTAVDTIAEINALATAVDKVMTLAKGVEPAAPLTVAELLLLGMGSNTKDDNLTAIVQQIKGTADDGSGVDTVQELQAVVSLGTIVGYAGNSSSLTAPTLLDYSNIGIHNDGLSSGTLSVVNSVIHGHAAARVDSASEIDAVISNWEHIVSQANGASPDVMPYPSASDYAGIGLGDGTMLASTTVGLNTSTTLGTDALALLNSVIGAKQRADLSALGKVTDLEHIVEKIMTQANLANDNATSNANNVSGLTSNDLTALGVSLATGINETNPTKWNKLVLLISNANIDEVNALDKLQTIASSQAVLGA
ncbi:MAG: hypothetical protein HXX19_05270, partial [Rhodoferax sp.]|nr:hypothetical protein [Rhodoferax sp.]